MNERILKSSVSIAALLTTIVASPAFAQDDLARDEITVTGSFVKTRSQADQISPITSIGADELSDVAAFNPADLVNTLTVNAGAQNNADGFNQSNSIGTTNINLRGLGVSSTLVLLNGRRQTQSAAATLTGDQFVDLNSLVPTIALDRVEILEDGATALYGSDAVAGVVNFLTRDTFTGFEANANFVTSTEDSQRDVQASVLWGGEWGGANLIAAFSFFDRTDLLAAERSDEFEQRNALSTFGQPGTFLPLAGPNAFQRQPDPACAATAETDPSVVGIIPAGPIAGTCQFDFGDFFTLVADEQRFQGYTKFTYDAGVVRIAIDGGYTANDIEAKTTPSQPILFPEVITPANPGNLSGFPELFFGRVLGAGSAPFTDTYESDTWRISAVVSGDLNDTWSWEAGFVRAQNQYDTVRSDTAVDRFQAAIAGVGGPNNDQFFNP
ncbi:MAG: TonB-dependent receptor plug domain-containing protein, partial [Pseudomonadota bacterium]